MVPGQAFRDARAAVKQEVRRGIVRICFRWQEDSVVIISGLIISRNGDSYEILADGTFFEESIKKGHKSFVVRFPTPESYGEEVTVNTQNVREKQEEFIAFDLAPNETEAAIITDYVRPVTFEIGNISRDDHVNVFYFPREKHITPTIYSPGLIIDATIANRQTLGVSFNNCATDEYAQYGSPLFNERGHLIGIMFATQARLLAWSVPYLSVRVLRDMRRRASYCRDGQIIPPE